MGDPASGARHDLGDDEGVEDVLVIDPQTLRIGLEGLLPFPLALDQPGQEGAGDVLDGRVDRGPGALQEGEDVVHQGAVGFSVHAAEAVKVFPRVSDKMDERNCVLFHGLFPRGAQFGFFYLITYHRQ